jgi:hypothetical protein
MPGANLTDRYRKVFIGSDAQDWSLSCGDLRLNDSPVDERGLILVSAQLDIQSDAENPESLSPRDNPTRWARGVPVLIQVRNAADDDWITPRWGNLYLLEEPDIPLPGQGITLQLGCLLSLRNRYEDDGDRSGVTLGTSQNCAAVASTLLQAQDIDSSDISLSGWPYSIAFPIGKTSGGSFVNQAGELAYSNDYRYLYTNASGVIVAGTLGFSISDSPTATVTLGTNDIEYSPERVEDPPSATTKAVGRGKAVESGTTTLPPTEVTGSKSDYSTSTVTCAGTGVIYRSTPSITITIPGDGSSDITYSTTTTNEAPRSAVFLDSEWSGGLPCSLISYECITETRYFEQVGGVGGKLKQIIKDVEKRRFTIDADDRTNALNWETVEREIRSYTYTVSDVIQKITDTTSKAEFTFEPDSNTPYNLRGLRQDITEWTQQGDSTWRKSETSVLPKAFTNASPEGASPYSQQVRGNTSVTSSGDNQPPKTEYWDGSQISTEQFYEGTFSANHGFLVSDKRPPFEIPYGFSDGQMNVMAEKHMRLITGRYRADYIELEISDDLLIAPPLFQVDVVDTDGDTKHYLADGASWVLSSKGARCGVVGVLLGTTASGGTVPDDSVPEALEAVTVDGVDVTVDGVVVYA